MERKKALQTLEKIRSSGGRICVVIEHVVYSYLEPMLREDGIDFKLNHKEGIVFDGFCISVFSMIKQDMRITRSGSACRSYPSHTQETSQQEIPQPIY